MLLTIKEFIETNTLIKLIDGRWYPASANIENWLEHDEHSQSFTQEDLATLDSRFTYVLPELAKITARKSGVWEKIPARCEALVPATLIRATLNYWNGLTFTLGPALGNQPIRGVGRIVPGLLDNNGPIIAINLHEYWLGHCSGENGEIFDFVAKHHYKTYKVERSWLEQCFPKWEERYQIADALSYADSTLLHYVFPLKEMARPVAPNNYELPAQVHFDCE